MSGTFGYRVYTNIRPYWSWSFTVMMMTAVTV